MSSSEQSPLEPEPLVALNCGACPQMIRLDARGELVHADGTEMCLAKDRVFPSIDTLLPLDSEDAEAVADMDPPKWARIEAHHRMHVESAEDRRRTPRGVAVAMVAFAVLVLGFGCMGYALLAMHLMGIELPW